MLVLTRKIDQRIRIGTDVEVVVLGIEGDHVKLGIQAPRQIPVLRYELVQGVQEENRRAAETAAASAVPQHSLLHGLASLRPPGSA
jgi:carbon storage regulator